MSKLAKVSKMKASQNVIQNLDEDEFSAGLYKAIFNEAQDAIMLVDLNSGKVIRANRAMEDLIGCVSTNLVGAPIEVLTPDSDTDLSRATRLTTDVLKQNGLHEDVVLRRFDGASVYVNISVRVIMQKGHPLVLCIMRYVGEKKKLERELITKHNELRSAYVRLEKANEELKVMQETLVQSGKLAALGELAAGIAHELNQPLTAIRGFAQEAQVVIQSMTAHTATHPQIDGDMKALNDFLKEIIKGSEKMERIISHLRGFTRKSTEDYTWVQLHDVIDEALKMLEQQFKGRGIQVFRQYDKTLPKVYANPFQLEQVFINFATNARDAIEEKFKVNSPRKAADGHGRLVIRTEKVTSVSAHQSAGAIDMVQVRIEDNGVGIAPELRNKIFNPFFTTKEVGKGMGLGLSISYGILSKINASVFVESEPGKGAAFTIRIPVDYRKT